MHYRTRNQGTMVIPGKLTLAGIFCFSSSTFAEKAMQEITYDLVIVGAGPAGLSTGIEAGRSGLQALILDQGGVAHSIQQFQRDMPFFSTPELLSLGGLPFVVPTTRPTSLDCVNYYRTVAIHFGLNCLFHRKVTGIAREGTVWCVTTASGERFKALHVVIATGYYDTPTPLNVPGEQLSHVTHYYRDPLPYFKQQVIVVGGKNSAVEAALDLWRHGAHVTVVHRGDEISKGVKYWILPDMLNRVKNGEITLHLKSTVKEFLSGETVIRHREEGERRLATDFVFLLIGYMPDTRFLSSCGVKIDADSLAPMFDPETMETNVPGLFVAGGLVGGRFNNTVFIENGREHGKKIVTAVIQTRA
jgi:thioredoxin reductase (NADPH)